MDHLLSVYTIVFLGVMVEAKYCPIEIDGDVKYYICPRNEICCTFGCCISSNFHFYQLWYYWLMVILMFLLCSGGTWWYRYWLHEGHYPTPPPPPHRAQLRRPPPTRVAYHAGRNTVVVHQMWKPPRNGPIGYPTPPPSYSLVQSTSEPATQTANSRPADGVPAQVAKLKPSPYYQMYGPPPSYDSVISESQRQPTSEQEEVRDEEQPVTRIQHIAGTVPCDQHSAGTNPHHQHHHNTGTILRDQHSTSTNTVDQVTQTHNSHSTGVQSTSRSLYNDATTTLPK